MRKARKPLCLLLCAVLLLSMSAAALGANNNYSSWFQTNYDEINKLGLMPESFNGLDLTKNITRGEMCELAVYAFEKATGKAVPYVIAPHRAGDVAECYSDPAKAKELLGWTAQYGLEDMCKDSWKWQSENPNGYRA